MPRPARTRGGRRRGHGRIRRSRAQGSQGGGVLDSARSGESGGGAGDLMVAGKCTGGELRRRRRFGLHRSGESKRKGGEEDVQKDRHLTLVACRCSSEAELAGRRRNRARRRQTEGRKTWTNATIPGLRARFLSPEDRGRRGGADGGFSLPGGGRERWR